MIPVAACGHGPHDGTTVPVSHWNELQLSDTCTVKQTQLVSPK